MSQPDSDERHLAIAANGEDVHRQIEGLEEDLRSIHAQLDAMLCAVQSLLRSPAMTTRMESVLRDSLEPAAEAIHWGAERLQQQVQRKRSVSGW
jgi:hypothetical protein